MNYEGTLNVIEACKAAGVRKIVMFVAVDTLDGSDVDGLTEDRCPSCRAVYLQVCGDQGNGRAGAERGLLR